MPPIRISEDIVPVGKFKARVSEVLRNLRANDRPIVITQGASPREFCSVQENTIS